MKKWTAFYNNGDQRMIMAETLNEAAELATNNILGYFPVLTYVTEGEVIIQGESINEKINYINGKDEHAIFILDMDGNEFEFLNDDDEKGDD